MDKMQILSRKRFLVGREGSSSDHSATRDLLALWICSSRQRITSVTAGADVTIMQYFLFHIGMGDSKNHKQPTGLRFQVYEQGRSAGPEPFRSESPIELDVTFSTDDGHVAVSFSN